MTAEEEIKKQTLILLIAHTILHVDRIKKIGYVQLEYINSKFRKNELIIFISINYSAIYTSANL